MLGHILFTGISHSPLFTVALKIFRRWFLSLFNSWSITFCSNVTFEQKTDLIISVTRISRMGQTVKWFLEICKLLIRSIRGILGSLYLVTSMNLTALIYQCYYFCYMLRSSVYVFVHVISSRSPRNVINLHLKNDILKIKYMTLSCLLIFFISVRYLGGLK